MDAAGKLVRSVGKIVRPEERLDDDSIGRILEAADPVGTEDPCAAVQRRMVDDPDLLAVAVVNADGMPVGLVNRHELLAKLSDRFGWALYERKPVTALMDSEPLVVECDVHFEELSRLIVSERPSALLSGFIVTEGGKYRGVGTALSLLRMSVERANARSRELERAREDAVAASGAKSRFLANMSHELRTPLNAIIGFSDIMRSGVFGPLGSERYAEYAADIHESGEHLLGVINDILDLSKVEAGKLEPKLECLDLAAALRAALRPFETEIRAAGLRLECSAPQGLPATLADPKMLRQIVFNLVSNAIKFTGAGGEISVRAAAGPGAACITVRDTGIGMDPADIPLVLEPFGQIDNGLDRRYEGTGLGLPLTRALVLAHGGEFSIESRKGEGTAVIFTLPWAENGANVTELDAQYPRTSSPCIVHLGEQRSTKRSASASGGLSVSGSSPG